MSSNYPPGVSGSEWQIVGDAIEEKIYDHQEQLILAEYGLTEMERANYGWGVDDTDDYICVETKVYGPGVKLTTWVRYDLPDHFEDTWEDI